MPIDDLRTPARRSTLEVVREDVEDDHEPTPTPERLAEVEAYWIVESLRRLKDLDEGREIGIPWEEAMVSMFAEPTPEELADLPPRRARR